MAQRRILVFPGSPQIYVNLIYLAARSRSHEVLERNSLGSLMPQLTAPERADLLHVHATDQLFTRLDSPAEARETLNVFGDGVRSFQARGGRVLWSAHGHEPDDPTFAEEVHEASRFLQETADVVHVTHPAMSGLLGMEHGSAAKRVVTIPHPSYQGIHAVRTRAEARTELGVDWTRRIILWLGAQSRPKDVHELLAALAKLAADGDAPVLVLPDHPASREPWANPDRVEVIRARDLPTSDVSVLLAASDLCVTPTRWAVDSASVSATLGVPVLMPGLDHLRAHFGDEPWVRFWDPNDAVESLAGKLASPATYDRPAGRMRAWSDQHAPFGVSRRMADLIEQVCEGGEALGAGAAPSSTWSTTP